MSLPDLSMKPQRRPSSTAAAPSVNRSARSNCGWITSFPDLFMYPYFPLIFTGYRLEEAAASHKAIPSASINRIMPKSKNMWFLLKPRGRLVTLTDSTSEVIVFSSPAIKLTASRQVACHLASKRQHMERHLGSEPGCQAGGECYEFENWNPRRSDRHTSCCCGPRLDARTRPATNKHSSNLRSAC